MLVEYSPSGKEVCQSAGPLNAKIVLIGESPAGEEMAEKPFPKPLVGPSGRLLNQALVKAGIESGHREISLRIIRLMIKIGDWLGSRASWLVYQMPPRFSLRSGRIRLNGYWVGSHQ